MTAADDKRGRAATVWAQPPEQPREPRVVLSRDKIVAAAIGFADREGIDALSMRKLADELGTRPMTLYRHLRSRDDLLELMYDDVIGRDPDGPHTGDWRADLRVMAQGIRDVGLAHPWAARMMTSGRPSFGPNALQGLEWALAAVSELGLPIDDMVRIVLTVIGVAQATVQTEVGGLDEQQRSGLTDAEWRASMAPYLGKILGTGAYPQVSRMVNRPHEQDDEAVFATTLDIVLDGLAQYIERRRAAVDS